MIIVGITGKARSGKDTTAEIINSHFSAEWVRFADPMKAAFSVMFNTKNPEYMSTEEKEAPIPGFNFSPRIALQTLGTEWGRSLDENLWIKLAEQRYYGALESKKFDTFIVSDVRFNNEAEWVRTLGGVLIEAVRPDICAVAAHSSEAGVSEELITETIYNDGTMNDLRDKVLDVAKDYIGLPKNTFNIAERFRTRRDSE